MKSELKKKDEHVIINISEIGDDKDLILKSLYDWKDGKCSCPTNEYEKLETLDINSDDNLQEIIVDLGPKKDERIAISDIENCLNYTASQISKKNSEST